jgi:hypothetical protein
MDSDEATMGLMARDILYHHKLVVMYYGQDYMGTFQAYVAAFFFTLLGPTVFALRLGVVLEFTAFLSALYVLSCLLYTRNVAIVSLLLVSLGPSQTLFGHVSARGGQTEVLLFGTLVSLLAVRLTFGAHTPSANHAQQCRRYGQFALWAFLAGFALWSDPLVVPFVLTSGLLILIYCWHERNSLAPLLIASGLLIGFSPYLVFFATVPREHVINRQIPFSTQLHRVSTHEVAPTVPLPQLPPAQGQYQQQFSSTPRPHYHDDYGREVAPPTYTQSLLGLLLVAFPVHTGVTPLCSIEPRQAWPLSTQSSPRVLACSAVHGTWTVAHVLLWGIAVWLAVRGLRLYARQRYEQTATDDDTRRQVTLRAARLLLLAAAGVTVFLYAIHLVPALVPWSSARYLVALNILTPGLISALWDITGTIKGRTRRSQATFVALQYATLVFVIGVLAQGTLLTLGEVAGARRDKMLEAHLMWHLENRGIHHFFTDYWTCDRLAFQSEERLTCAVLDEQLQPGLDRDWPYRAQVYGDADAAFVFAKESQHLKVFMQRIAGSEQTFERSEIANYVVYRPTGSRVT